MDTPFFSIVIPTLNEEHTLPHLLDDLNSQTFTNFETIVVDGNSEDKTQAIAKKHEWVQLLSLSKGNVSAQRNYGADHAKGKWLIFFDADTRIDTTFLRKLHDKIEKKQCDACNVYALPDQNDLPSRLYISLQNLLFESTAAMGTPYAVGACFIMKRSVFHTTKGFDPTISHMEDSELAQRLTKMGFTFCVFKQPLFIYSLRRQRKNGTLKIIFRLLPYFINSWMWGKYTTPADAYPMNKGGKEFISERHS